MISEVDIRDMEDWKDIPSWKGLYQASSIGRIRSLPNIRSVCGRQGWYHRSYGGQVLSPKQGNGGYLYVNLWSDNKGHMRAVHRLVCEAFNPHPNFDTLVTNHKDGVRTNNQPKNLEFITQRENLIDSEKRTGIPVWKAALNKRVANWWNTLSKT